MSDVSVVKHVHFVRGLELLLASAFKSVTTSLQNSVNSLVIIIIIIHTHLFLGELRATTSTVRTSSLVARSDRRQAAALVNFCCRYCKAYTKHHDFWKELGYLSHQATKLSVGRRCFSPPRRLPAAGPTQLPVQRPFPRIGLHGVVLNEEQGQLCL